MSDGRASYSWRKAEMDLQKACELLQSPAVSNLESSAAILANVVENLQAQRSRPAMAAGDPHTLEAPEAFRLQLRKARLLLDAAAGYRQGWMRRLESLGGEYTPAGETLRIEIGGCLRLRG